MNARVLLLAILASATGCKLDSTVFSGDAVSEYRLPVTNVPDSLRREVTFGSGGETLHGFLLRQPGAAPRLTVVFSHGKGGNLAQDVEWQHAEWLWMCGYDVLTYDYRGFGRSTGVSSDGGTLAADAQAALGFALTQPGVTRGRVVSYGHSLGSAPAISLAAANPGMRALVLESGFANGQAMAESADPLGFPVTWLLRNPLENTKTLASVTAPVLIMHGDGDKQIPVSQANDLRAAVRSRAELRIVTGAGHEDVQKVIGLPALRTLLAGFTNAVAP